MKRLNKCAGVTTGARIKGAMWRNKSNA